MGRLAREFHLEELLSSCRGRPLVRDRGKGHGHPRCVGRLGAPLPLALVPSLAQPDTARRECLSWRAYCRLPSTGN
jgi:hypothetical protein